MRIAVMTDVHANLPALEAALDDIRRVGVDAIYHTGDAVGYGPFPGETLERMAETPDMRFVLGNHDRWFAESEPSEPSGEAASFEWFYNRVDPAWKQVVASWPVLLKETFGATTTAFVHYALDETGEDWEGRIHNRAEDVEAIFRPLGAGLVFFGHTHSAMDVVRQARYVNPGALGIGQVPVARYAMVDFDERGYRLEHRGVPYDNLELFAAFERNRVPDWQIWAFAMTGR